MDALDAAQVAFNFLMAVAHRSRVFRRAGYEAEAVGQQHSLEELRIVETGVLEWDHLNRDSATM